MSKLEKAYLQLTSAAYNTMPGAPDSRVCILVTVLYLCLLLSVPLDHLSQIIWFALYPVITSAIIGIRYSKIFIASLFIIPLLALIGIFNPIFDTRPLLRIGNIVISNGWITFTSIIFRGLFALQSVLILIRAVSFEGLCRGLRRLGIPAFLTDQLLFVFRYISVLLMETITVRRAIDSRGYGKKHLPIRLWGRIVGQLFIRTLDRADKIHQAMLARGFSGTLPEGYGVRSKLNSSDLIFLIGWSGALILMRVYNISALLFHN